MTVAKADGPMHAAALRVGLIGAGGMGKRHMLSLRRAGLGVVGVADPAPSARTKFAEEFNLGAGCLFDDSELMLFTSRPDVVIVASTGPYHRQGVQQALKAGARFIVCEKPMATSGSEAREMAGDCARMGCRLAVNMSRRYAPRYRRLKDVIQSGTVGVVRHMSFSIGAGGLGCVGSHFFDLASWLINAHPVRVRAVLDSHVPVNVRGAEYSDSGGAGMVEYDNGSKAFFELSNEVQIMPVFTVSGTHGYVEVDEWSGVNRGRITVYSRPEQHRGVPQHRFVQPEKQALKVGPALDPVDLAYSILTDLLGEHVEDTVTGGVETIDTVMAFHLSHARQGENVELPLAGPDLEFRVPIT